MIAFSSVHNLLVCNFRCLANLDLLCSTASSIGASLDLSLHANTAWQQRPPVLSLGNGTSIKSLNYPVSFCYVLLSSSSVFLFRLMTKPSSKQPTQPRSSTWLGSTAAWQSTPPSTTWQSWSMANSWKTNHFQFLPESNLLPTLLGSCSFPSSTWAFGTRWKIRFPT